MLYSSKEPFLCIRKHPLNMLSCEIPMPLEMLWGFFCGNGCRHIHVVDRCSASHLLHSYRTIAVIHVSLYEMLFFVLPSLASFFFKSERYLRLHLSRAHLRRLVYCHFHLHPCRPLCRLCVSSSQDTGIAASNLIRDSSKAAGIPWTAYRYKRYVSRLAHVVRTSKHSARTDRSHTNV